MKLHGKVHKYGANVDTDVILPGRYLNISEPAELAKHCLEGIDPDFVHRVRPGDFIVATTNFGGGSSREHAPLALKTCGISGIIAQSFARIFFRNALNIGLPILECEEAALACKSGDLLEVELSTGEIRNLTRGLKFQAKPYPEFVLELLSCGGLVEYTRKKLESE